MNELNLFIPIKKVDVAQRLVYGTLAAEVADHSGEIMDYETAKPAFKEWSDAIAKATDGKSVGNVRAMHTAVSAGKLTDISFDDATKSIMGCAKIVDDNEWNKVLEGVYTGFSLGGAYKKRWTCPANASLKRYTPSVAEVSIVDNPCIPSATFDVIKADGSHELRKFKVATEAESDIEQVWRSKKDGECFAKKAEAQHHNLDLVLNKATTTVEDALESLKKAREAMDEKVDAIVEAAADVITEVVTEPSKTEDAAPATEEDAATKGAAFKAAVTKALLAKQLCDLPQLVEVIYSLQWIHDGLEWDTLFDDADTSTLPADMKAILSSLCAFLKAMVEDATADITADAGKAAGLTIGQVEAIRKAIDKPELMKDFGVEAPVAEDPVEKAMPENDLAKMLSESKDAITKITAELEAEKAAKADLESAVGTLKSGIDEMTKGIGDMKKEIAHLQSQPMPAKGKASVTVIKGHEGTASGAEDIPDEVLIQKFFHLPPEQARERFAEAKAKRGQ